jgi:hypothetical protein
MKPLNRLTARGDLIGGKLVMKNPKWFRGMLQQYDDCAVMVTVERKRKSRSKEQLGYLWGVVYPTISEHTGHSPEELHAIYKAKFLKRKVHWRGADMAVLTSTSRLTANEMAEFITNIIVDAAELEIEIPEPDKDYQWK